VNPQPAANLPPGPVGTGSVSQSSLPDSTRRIDTGNTLAKVSQPALVLGIDTGGTFTDGVLLEYESRRVLASHKSLTTKRDFSLGIERVVEGIDIENASAIRMVSISTTLATNAIAEGKGKRVALLLIGYDPELINAFKMEVRFATPHYHFFEGGHDLYGREKASLDLPGVLATVNELKNDVDAIAISSYFSPLNPEHENRAFQAVSRICDLPVVLGHQLSTKLGSVERATTAALNASLLAMLQDFIIAVRRAMERRQIHAPLMVVRGDGTLMSDEFAARTPVETIHSGPAASAIGGRFLSGLDDALVIDVGGTTTDIAMIEAGQVAVSEDGATVAGGEHPHEYKTSVRSAKLLSIALGGDSHIRLGPDKGVIIGPERVAPLAYLASQYPHVAQQLSGLSQRNWSQVTPDHLEYWYLLREPPRDILKSQRERELVRYLRAGPQPVPKILKQLDLLHIAQVGVDGLLRQEIVGKAGLTSTDLMHIEGRYSAWNRDASAASWETFCRYQFEDPTELRRQVWTQMGEMIIQAIIVFLSGRALYLSDKKRSLEGTDEDLGRWFFYNSLYPTHPHLETRIRLRGPIIGLGAPAGIFLPEVARALHTELILPEHHGVANAVGAIAGSVMVEEEILVYPHLSSSGLEVLAYYVQASDERLEFQALDEALIHARKLSQERALGAAIRSGADNPQVTITEITDGLDTWRIRAKAIGNPRLAE
jgi:N-methylhydantoinase A/oxoprolinase/acetone carboxylase beta subunit